MTQALQRRRENMEAALAGGQQHTWRQRPGSAGNAEGRAGGMLYPPWTPPDGQDATGASDQNRQTGRFLPVHALQPLVWRFPGCNPEQLHCDLSFLVHKGWMRHRAF